MAVGLSSWSPASAFDYCAFRSFSFGSLESCRGGLPGTLARSGSSYSPSEASLDMDAPWDLVVKVGAGPLFCSFHSSFSMLFLFFCF